MPRQVEEIPLVALKLNFSSRIPLYIQLYNLLRNLILKGKFSKDQKLPSTRSLAQALKVSRNTVDAAFDQLVIEGYIYKKKGSGTFVSEIPDNFFRSALPQKKTEVKPTQSKKELQKCVKQLESVKNLTDEKTKKNLLLTEKLSKEIGPPELIKRYRKADNIIPFQNGVPAIAEFPFKVWNKLIKQVMSKSLIPNLGYGDAAGFKPLREAIASYLRTYRAVNCSAEQIIIVNGTQQGLDLVGRVLLKSPPQRAVWVEDPGYFSARASMLFTGTKIFPCSLDNEGLDISYSKKNNPRPDLIFTTPSHQFPLGLTMSISRRLNLLQYAKQNECWILEDDYDSGFRYSGNPLPSLQGMDQDGRVIYLGTFSKVLFPGLRIGYLVLPNAEMFEAFAMAKSLMDRQNPIFEQIVLSKFLEEGYFTRHLRRMRLLYKSRQDFLINEVNKNLKGIAHAEPSPAGMHLILWLSKNLNDKKIANEVLKNNLIVRPLSEYSIKFKKKPGLLLGYAAFNEDAIKHGVNKLKKILFD